MFESVTIEGYRCFKKLQVDGLKRVNLIVGKNNSGKTSLMEAIRGLASGSNEETLFDNLRRRRAFQEPGRYGLKYSFFGRPFPHHAQFTVDGVYADKTRRRWLVRTSNFGNHLDYAGVVTAPQEYTMDYGGFCHFAKLDPIDASSTKLAAPQKFRNMGSGFTQVDKNGYASEFKPSKSFDDWVDFSDFNLGLLSGLWRLAFDAGEEEKIDSALRIVEPRIRSVSFLPALPDKDNETPAEGDLVLFKVEGQNARVPLSMFGEGTRLLLTMSTTLIAKRGTQVFIDEIDTGLHHSVLADMWKMVIKTAEANDVQVFATTHSRDCIDGLAIALLDDESLIDKVSLHRVEQGRENTVVSHGESIITIGAQGIEVRG